MSTPFLSVVMPTMRAGGLDVVFAGLRGQTFRDFEFIIADGLRSHREIVGYDYVTPAFGVQWLEPDPNPFPLNAFCKYANAGLAAARGEVVVFCTDYTWLAPDALEKHAAFHRSHFPNEGYMAPHQYIACPPLHADFPVYEPATGTDTERYAEDVTSGRLDRFGWSIFAKPFDQDPREMPLCPVQAGADPKLTDPPGPCDKYRFHGKNESCRRERAQAVMWNEKLDGTHGWQDSDMADALGLNWTVDPGNVAYIVNPRSHFPVARRLRDYMTNEAIWKGGRS